MYSHKMAARTYGIFFIITFLSYGTGSGLIDSIVTVPNFLSNIYQNQSQIVIGVLLMAIVHTITNIGLPVIILPILKPHNRALSYGYLGIAIGATIILVVGALFLLLLIPLSEVFVKAGSASAVYYETIGVLLKKGGYYAYHLGMALWSLGGLMFVAVLYKSKLIPRPMSVWGLIGYITLVTGSILEIFEHNEIIEIISVIPGGLWEITLSIWLIVKGFNPSAIVTQSAAITKK